MDRIKGVKSRCLLGCNKRGCFSLPKNPEMRQKWLDVLPKQPTSKWSMLCEDHFDPSQIIPKSVNKQRILLKSGTVPSIFYIHNNDLKIVVKEEFLDNSIDEIELQKIEQEEPIFMSIEEFDEFEGQTNCNKNTLTTELVSSFEHLVNNVDTKLRLMKNGWKRELLDSEEDKENTALVIYKLDFIVEIPCIAACLKITKDLQVSASVRAKKLPIKSTKGILTYNYLQDIVNKLGLQNVNHMKDDDTSLPEEVKASNVFQFLRKQESNSSSKMCRFCLLAEWNIGPDMFKQITPKVRGLIETKYDMAVIDSFPEWICLNCDCKAANFMEINEQATTSEEIFAINIGKFNEHKKEEELRIKKEQEAIDSVMTKMALEYPEEFEDDISVEYNYDDVKDDDDFFEEPEPVAKSTSQTKKTGSKSRPKNNPLIKEACKKAINQAIKNIQKGKKSRGIKTPRECDLCGLIFDFRDVLIKHMKNYHMTNPIECSYCKKIFNGELKLKIHIKSVHELRHLCNICGQKFPLPSELKIHLSEKHGRKGEHICDICNSDFAVAWFLKRHMKTAHPNETVELSMHVCDVCGKEFCTASAMKRHKTQVHNKMNSHKKEPQYGSCKHCGIKFDDPAELTQHTKQHTNIFPCDVCSRRFKTEGMLQNHRKRHENEVRPWACNDCTRRYNTQQQLQVHIRREHENDRNYECPQCSKMFYSAHEVKVHMKRHAISADEILSCPLCEHKTKSYQNLRKHAFANHTNSRYKCPACGREYKQIKNFEEHVQREHQDLYDSGFCYKDYYVEDEAKMQHVLSLITHGGKERC